MHVVLHVFPGVVGVNLEIYFNLFVLFHRSVLEVPFWDRPWILEFRPSHSAAVHGPEQINADDDE